MMPSLLTPTNFLNQQDFYTEKLEPEMNHFKIYNGILFSSAKV